MQAVLTQINSVPGIVGSMLCDENGRLAARVFPPLFDAAMIEEAAEALTESFPGFEGPAGSVEMLDFRYLDGRIIVKPLPQAFLMLLCTKAVNMQLLTISLNVAAKKLEKLLAADRQQPAPAVAAAAAGPVEAAATPLDRKKGVGVPLTLTATKSTANNYWDNMLETVSLNRATSIKVSDFFQTGSFKKLKLINQANGRSRKFPVYIIKDDAERLFDGKVVVSRASMETLGAADGDQVVAVIEIGGGFLGWEGI